MTSVLFTTLLPALYAFANSPPHNNSRMGLQQPPEETTPLLHDGPDPEPVPDKHPKRTVALLAITIILPVLVLSAESQ